MSEKAVVNVFQTKYSEGRWLFTVKYKGVTHEFFGAPNLCRSAQSARMRGWWRKRWMENGTYDKHYQ